MDVRSARDVVPVGGGRCHPGTVPVWWLFQPGELKDVTKGGFLKLVASGRLPAEGSSTRTRIPLMSSITSSPEQYAEFSWLVDRTSTSAVVQKLVRPAEASR